jgi:hypothetical protein
MRVPVFRLRLLWRVLAVVLLTSSPWGVSWAQGTCVTGTSNNSSCRLDVNISSTIQATRRLVVTPGTS